jgi:hypothetical protein
MTRSVDDIEAELWEIFDAATDLGDGRGRLNRNRNDTQKGQNSRRHFYRQNLEREFAAGHWTASAEWAVQVCVTKAGRAARHIADDKNADNCTLKIFNLASQIAEASYAIDVQMKGGAQGIIC